MVLRCPFWDLGNVQEIITRTYLSQNNSCALAVERAIKDGYRLIDTAVAYKNHKEVGEAIQKCIREGIVKRSDLFICTKVWLYDWHKEDVKHAVDVMLEELQLDTIDLLLIHQSVFFNLTPEQDKKRREGYFFDYDNLPADDPKYRLGYKVENMKELWSGMEDVCRQVGFFGKDLFVGKSQIYWCVQFFWKTY